MSGNAKTLGGEKKLSLLDAVAQSVGFMGPVFSVAFLVPLIVGITSATGNGAGTGAALSVVLAGIGIIGIGWIVAEYARRIQAAGSLYTYVSDGFGPRIGAAAGYVYYTGIMLLSAGILVMIGGTAHDTIAGEFNWTGIPYLGWDLILLAIVGSVLYLGVALSTRVQLVLALCSIAVVFVFSLYVIVKSGGVHHIGSGFSPNGSPKHWTGILFGVLYGVLLFTGFESSANLGEETERPERNIPRAVLMAVVIAIVFYVIGVFAQVSGFHFNLAAIGKANAAGPLFVLAGPAATGGFASVALRRLVELVVLFDMVAVLIGTAVAASRGFFSLARDGRLPRAVATVSRRGTPLGGNVVMYLAFVVTIILALKTSVAALPMTPEYVCIFSWMSTYGGFALTVIYLALALGAIKGLKDHAAQGKLWAAIIVAAVVSGAAIFGGLYKVAEPTLSAPLSVIGVLILGLIAGFAMPVPSGADDFSTLVEADQGPQKI
jgi:amino acid transporter